MAKSNSSKPTFGRKMEPCEYNAKWANKLPKDQIVSIVAEDNTRRIESGNRDETR